MYIFRKHGEIYPIVSGRNPHGFVWFLFVVAPAPFCVISLFFCWRNANLAGRFAGRRCCRVFSLCFGLTMMCLVYEAKVFHLFCTLFYRFSHCQDRALERDRPQQREKKGVNEPTNSTDIERRRMSTGPKLFVPCGDHFPTTQRMLREHNPQQAVHRAKRGRTTTPT